jgi:hypothetical protein
VWVIGFAITGATHTLKALRLSFYIPFSLFWVRAFEEVVDVPAHSTGINAVSCLAKIIDKLQFSLPLPCKNLFACCVKS